MGTTKNLTKRFKFGKFKIGKIQYFKSRSIEGSKTYHYKRKVKINGQYYDTTRITKKKYEQARNKRN